MKLNLKLVFATPEADNVTKNPRWTLGNSIKTVIVAAQTAW
jgi:hypothetical protein